ncbi:junctional sarcoplasmic reticulum protein 1-like [Callorhinchus milii]|uniref:junctional sarcoplasmic reticulum protein 1-like n=1 Tax=Callorhinchus milii TaxID=7868 RepID=UPI001C3FD1C2|nr:junctional sarcoplasmic reticulum protein 1-like [Callorhinchus milii]XP_042198628.1 junctional sarcoplasmic reticulum protein 1-like [Callorhinchus milii]
MEEDIFKSVEEDLAEAIQELPPQAEPSRRQDVQILKKSKKISEKSDDTEKEKDELQIEEIRTENSRRRSDRQKAPQKTITETAKDTKQSSKKTGEVKLPRLGVEKIEAKVAGEEDPLAGITLNRCLIVATVIVLLTMGVQVIAGVFELDDEADSMLSYSDNGLPDDDDLTLDVRTAFEDRGHISGPEKVAEHEKKVPFAAPARTDARKRHERPKDEAAQRKPSPQAKDIKVPRGGFKPKDGSNSASKTGPGKEHKHKPKPKPEKRDDKHFKKEHKSEKHRGLKEPHFKEGEDKKFYKGKEEARDKGGKFNHSSPRKYDKNAKQDTYRKHQGQARDFEKHKPYGRNKPRGDDVSRKHDYKGHKEYDGHSKQQLGPVRADERDGVESGHKKPGAPKPGGKNRFTESKRHD